MEKTTRTTLTQRSVIELYDLYPELLEHPATIDIRICHKLPHPLHVLIERDKAAPHIDDIRVHQTSNPLELLEPVPLDLSTQAQSIEAALLRMTRGLNIVQVIALFDESCGTYRRPRKTAIASYVLAHPYNTVDLYPTGASVDGCRAATIYGLEPLTSVAKLSAYVESHPGAAGARNARKALPYCVDGLRSYLEMEYYLLAHLPAKLGGANVPPPQVNYRIDLPPKLQKICGKPYIIADNAWPEAKVVLELLGEAHHSGDGVTDTSVRNTAYDELGWKCLTMSSTEVETTNMFEATVESLARCLGVRLRHVCCDYSARRRWLRGELIVRGGQEPPNHPSYKVLLGETDEDPDQVPLELRDRWMP